MFFSEIEKWDGKKLWLYTLIGYIVQVLLLIVAPVIVVACKYNIFGNGTKKLTGMGIILLICVGVTAYIFLRKAVNKLPCIKPKHQKLKFTLQTILDLIPMVLIFVAMVFVKDELDTAYATIRICAIFVLIFVIFRGVYMKYIDAEWTIRNAGQMVQAVEIRKQNGVL